MSEFKYVLAAAELGTDANRQMAEALVWDVDASGRIEDQVIAAREEARELGLDMRSTATLMAWRRVAVWMGVDRARTIRWVEGVSMDTARRAMEIGLSAAELREGGSAAVKAAEARKAEEKVEEEAAAEVARQAIREERAAAAREFQRIQMERQIEDRLKREHEEKLRVAVAAERTEQARLVREALAGQAERVSTIADWAASVDAEAKLERKVLLVNGVAVVAEAVQQVDRGGAIARSMREVLERHDNGLRTDELITLRAGLLMMVEQLDAALLVRQG